MIQLKRHHDMSRLQDRNSQGGQDELIQLVVWTRGKVFRYIYGILHRSYMCIGTQNGEKNGGNESI